MWRDEEAKVDGRANKDMDGLCERGFSVKVQDCTLTGDRSEH